ncbi:hypothetical protein EMN47_05005 [Prolixibacteraceae bacterium JC049]|nr:hypothetical protein [Prolixibacteraceae bacterium JC049]
MKNSILRSATLLVAFLLVCGATFAQRVIKGTVYLNGEPASGVTVGAHKSSDSYFTSFDGKYEIKVHAKTKYIKFSFLDETKKLSIEGKDGDTFDFPFDGVEPKVSSSAGGVSDKSHDQLVDDSEYLQNASLYDQFRRQKDYKSALPHWRFVYTKYPKSSKNIYLHGVKIYEKLLDKASSQKVKRQYLDTIMSVYDQRIKNFGDEGYVIGKKLYDFGRIVAKKLEKSEEESLAFLKKAYEMGEKSIELQGAKSELAVFVIHFPNIVRLYNAGEFEKDKVLEAYDKLMGLVEVIGAKAKTDDEKKGYAEAKSRIDDYFQKSGAADCEALIRIYTPKFAEHADDAEAIKKMLRMLDRQGCDDSELYMKGSEQLYKIAPSAEAAYNMAKMFIRENDNAKAVEYFNKAIAEEKDNNLKAKYTFELAVLSYKNKDLKGARNIAKKSLALNPKNGEALKLIGLIYATSSSKFSTDAFEKQTVFWVAVDYFNRAKKADPSIAADCNRLIKTYKGYFPKKEEAFMRTLTDGSKYKVEGWINETTTVRTIK